MSERGSSPVAKSRHGACRIAACLFVAFACGERMEAGDILRGGATMSSSRRNAAASTAGADAAGEAKKNFTDRLARTSQALQAVRNMQNAARNAALANNAGDDPNHPGQRLPDVPNGLGTGGLDFQSATGAGAPSQSGDGNAVKVTIEQTQQQAVLNWKTFNVGRQTTLQFDQSAGGDAKGEWIAFNKVTDPSGSPSQILGSIKADGQVYVINQNGIIFGGGSQVNVHALVASSLPINDNLISRGLLNNPDSQFLFSALPLAAGTVGGTPAFTPSAPLTPNGHLGDVTVQEGASLTSPTNPEHTGGKIALIGANVSNQGAISTPDGQTILAAGLQVGFGAHDSTDATLRGLDVYVGAVKDPASADPVYAGTAENSGVIDIPRADAFITGKTVNQLGVIDSTTSVSLNGRVDLVASYDAIGRVGNGSSQIENGNPKSASVPFVFQSTGLVNLGAGSVMSIIPEYDSLDKVAGTSLALRSQINIQGQNVHFGVDSLLLAPNAQVAVDAGAWFFLDAGDTEAELRHTSGQIYLDHGAMIDVAGSAGVSSPNSENILSLQLRGSEFADTPLQRTSLLKAATIYVDIRNTGAFDGISWVGTPLGDVSGFVNLLTRTVAELTLAGGSVDLRAGGSVVTQKDSTIDVSGGYTNFSAGMVHTTRVMTGGRIIDIADATPDQIYDGIYNGDYTDTSHPKWGIAETFHNPLSLDSGHWEDSYIQGAAGGSITITAPAMALDGQLAGATVNGPRQIRSTAKSSSLAPASSLALNFQMTAAVNPLAGSLAVFPALSPTPPTILFGDGASQAAVASFSLDSSGVAAALPADRLAEVVISPKLFKDDGFGALTIGDPDGNISVPAKTLLELPVGGSLTLSAANLDVQGKIIAPGGALKFTVLDASPFLTALVAARPVGDPLRVLPAADPSRGLFTLGPSALLSTAGLIVDDRLRTDEKELQPIQNNGGSIDVEAYSADFAVGSVVDVSGGGVISEGNSRAFGNGGSIAIAAGQDPQTITSALLGGQLNLGASLRGFSVATGGSLSLKASRIQVGGSASDPDTLLISPEFFNEGGFSSFALTGLGNDTTPGVLIAPGTVIHPVISSWVAAAHGGAAGGIDMQEVTEPEGVRAPVSLSFNAVGVSNSFFDGFAAFVSRGNVVMGAGSSIFTDALASVSFSGDTVDIEGSVIAPGGAIKVAGGGSYLTPSALPTALVTVALGTKSLLSTAGKLLLTPDPYGRRMGTVLPGGSITVSGNIVAEAGAVLDVSGATGILDVLPAALGLTADQRAIPLTSGIDRPLNSLATIPVQEDSNGGSIVLKGAQELLVDATLLGRPGGPTALGGTLSITSGRFYHVGDVALADDLNLVVTQSGQSISPGFYAGGQSVIGKVALDSSGAAVKGEGFFAVDSFEQGGFDILKLNGNVQFSGPVNIGARSSIFVGTGGVIAANDSVTLTAPYVALGQPFLPPLQSTEALATSVFSGYPAVPTFGPGSLTVNARLIDVGNLVLKNIGQASLIADDGDIRGDGTFDIMGNLYLRAAQIYPVTETNFTLAAYDYLVGGLNQSASITIDGSGDRALPLSAGGVLSLYASIINQGGVLRAPLGTINLGWDGTGTPPVNALADPSNPSPGFTPLPISATQQLTLSARSETSVSAVDNGTGQPLLIPFGIVGTDGETWIDPSGLDITTTGLANKQVNLAGVNVTTEAGSVIDVRGGGDVLAYNFIKGNGGNNDILGTPGGTWSASLTYAAGTLVSFNGETWSARQMSGPNTDNGVRTPSASQYWSMIPQSYAVIPGYDVDYAPYAAFNQTAGAANLNNDPGFVNSGLSVGDQVYLNASKGLAAGVYTLLPARYALLPGAFLVTERSGAVQGSVTYPDGSSIVSGYEFNDLDASRTVPTIRSNFEVDPAAVINSRAQYNTFTGDSFFKAGAMTANTTVPRLPIDSGHVVFDAVASLSLQGSLLGKAPDGGIDAYVDVSSPVDILITNKPTPVVPNQLVIDPAELNGFDAASLVIGGVRQTTATGISLLVNATSLTLDNAGDPLLGADITLAAKGNLTVAPGAEIEQQGSIGTGADDFQLTGPGTLLRVSSDPSATITRTIGTTAATPSLLIGAGASISGQGLILDSSYGMSIDPAATIAGGTISLDAGQIIMELNNSGVVPSIAGLMLAGPALAGLEGSAKLSLLSYSTLDIYGNGSFDVAGELDLHAGQIRGFNPGGSAVAFSADTILLDNSAGGAGASAAAALAGSSLSLTANNIFLGAGNLSIDQYANVALTAANNLVEQKTGALAAQNALTITTPLVGALDGATETISAGGALLLDKTGIAPSSAPDSLGASLTLRGTSVTVNNGIFLPSGVVALEATSGDVIVNGMLDVAGTTNSFGDVTSYTDGGNISLTADTGSVLLGAGSILDVSAPAGGGSGGSLAVKAAAGSFTTGGSMSGGGGSGGENGSFSLEVGSLPTLSVLSAALDAADFTNSRSIRVTTGNVLVDGATTVHQFNLSTDQGSITVAGTIDASGETGGTIDLEAHGGVTLLGGSLLTVAAQDFNDAGEGGLVDLEAGSSLNGVAGVGAVDIQTGSKIDLSVAAKTASSASLGDFSGKLHIRAPQNTAMNDLSVNPINGTIVDPSSIQIEGYEVFDLTDVGGVISGAGTTQAAGGVITDAGVNVQGSILANGNAFGGASVAIKNRLLTGANAGLQGVAVVSPGAEIVNTAATTPVSLSLMTSGASSIAVPTGGGSIVFPQGTLGNDMITSSVAATIISANGQTRALNAGTPTALAAGDTLSVGTSSTISFASGGTGGPVALQVSPGTSFTASTANAAATLTTKGAAVTFTTVGTSKVNLAAGSTILFTVGTPGTRQISSTVAGTIKTAAGATIALAANTPTTIAVGSTLTLATAGSVTYLSTGAGTGTPAATLLAGSLTTAGPTGVTGASGNLTLGTPSTTTTSDWNLATYRFGPQSAPGVLTLRAAGNLVFFNALSDGFTTSAYNSLLLAQNSLLPVDTQSYSYRLAAGADLTAADFRQVTPLANLAAGSGSVLIGKNATNQATSAGQNATTASAVGNNFQTIRTGSGDIEVNAGRDVQLLNEFSNIYTVGTRLLDPTALAGGFDVPVILNLTTSTAGTLGNPQETTAYAAQYTMAGGNVTLDAQNDIARYTKSSTGILVTDSEKELPDNWLERRGFVDPLTGAFGVAKGGDVASTSWWIDFADFFEGVGALGGGNVTLNAGRNVSNVDAVAPTNMRVSKNSATAVELGGGDVVVHSGADIDGGVYYVERGEGTLQAGGSIHTNSTRSPAAPGDTTSVNPLTWLPTTLFAGDASFNVSARGDVLLGPVANPFLLPEGYNNTFWYKTYFSTYGADDVINVSSLGGAVNLREGAGLNGDNNSIPLLQMWLQNMLSYSSSSPTTTQSGVQPWLRLDESSVIPFKTVVTLLPPTLKVTAFSGDINLQGSLTLSPSAVGTIDLLTAGSINGLQPTGGSSSTGVDLTHWSSSQIDLSDANPASIPGILTPIAAQTVGGTGASAVTARVTSSSILASIDQLFAETGATNSVTQTKQALHAPGPLHAGDTDPVRLYAAGDISGLSLFTGKFSQIMAGGSITDIAFYLQNVSDKDLSVVSSGANLVAYDANAPLLIKARSAGNVLNDSDGPLAGDIQINGPGTLEVLAGGNLDLGIGTQNADGTGAGITSVGNLRNPFLSAVGADLVVAAGFGPALGLANSFTDATTFLTTFGASPDGMDYLDELTQNDPSLDSNSPEGKALLALQVFYLTLRDAGRAASPLTVAERAPAFAPGFAAIAALFDKTDAGGEGNILTRERDIRTKAGGDIEIFAPQGGLTLEPNLPNNAAASASQAPPGIITEAGGDISIFTDKSVDIGVGRIFTLHGGNEIIWSSKGDIAAGNSSKTVQSAPPTRVTIDPQSGDVTTDLAGLATGGGIGVLATVAGVPAGNVDLVTPAGVVDAGDAGIRASGQISIAATAVLNASNISAPGGISGVPAAPAPPAVNVSGLASGANSAAAGANAANSVANQSHNQAPQEEAPSIITVDVLGYGGGDDAGT